MLKNKTINIGVLQKIANALGDLNKSVVFVGGAVASLYADDTVVDEVRPTFDIDISVQLRRFGNVFNLQEKLRQLNFKESAEEKVICRFKFEDVTVDVMPDEDSLWGSTNRWYKPGFEKLEKVSIGSGIVINILPAPYYLATKFEAFNSRGNNDYIMSHDFEDIVFLLDNRVKIAEEVLATDREVKDFLQQEIRRILEHKYIGDLVQGHINPETSEARLEIILTKMKKMMDSNL